MKEIEAVTALTAELEKRSADLARLERARDSADAIIAAIPLALLVLDADLRIERANRAFCDTFRVTDDDVVGQLVYDIANRQWDTPPLRQALAALVAEGRPVDRVLLQPHIGSLGRRHLVLSARRAHDPGRDSGSVLLTFDDVTERQLAELLLGEQRRLLGLLASGEPLDVCLNELCQGITRIAPGVRACVLLTDDERTAFTSITCPAIPDLPSFIRGVPIANGWAGTCGRAVTTGEPVTSTDIANDSRWPEAWRTICRSHAVQAGYAEPVVMADAGVLGSVCLWFDERRAPTSYDRRLAAMATAVVASALRRDLGDQALRQREARYRSLAEAVTSLIWTANARGRFATMQGPWSAYTGQTWEQLRDSGWLEALHPDDRERVRSRWQAAVASGTTYEATGRIWHAATGAYRRFEARAVPVVRADGSIREWVGHLFDVEDRSRAEEALGRLAALVESSDDAIVSKDLDGTITSWNRGAERLFGYSAAEVLGQSIDIVIPPDRASEEAAIRERIRRSETVSSFETVRRRKDGTLFDASVTVSPIRDDQGRVIGASKIARDITSRKHIEDVLRENDRRKNEFLAMLAHELRNPLEPILVSIDILKRAAAGTSTRDADPIPANHADEALDVLQRQTGHMARLVDDLLDAGRISRGRIELRREQVELASIVHHAVEAVRPLSDKRGQELSITLPATPVYLNADPTRVAQMIGNLLNNASKFTDSGGHIWLTVERPGRGEVVIRVRDTGIGLAADRLERIFDVFTQVDASLQRSTAGLGIGLSLVRALAEMHGGSVEATSPGLGRGSEFIVRLPTDPDPPPASPSAPAPEPTETPRRVLIVDDNRDSADTLGLLLSLNGHETHAVYDGMAAVEAAERIDPDVVVLDIGLPGLSGYDVARRIREQSGPTRPLLVALTGWGQDEDRRRSEEAGFDAHLVKPLDEAALRALMAGLDPDPDQP